ncbi:MAG: hypothetical protein J6O04_05315 [Selenomonadaceae bacterium]|nr:hypothetical protein [Selenomonadaceae bacterium]
MKRKLRILIDTNIAFTFLSERNDPFSKEALKIMSFCARGKIYGYLAFHSLSIIWYLCRKVSERERRRMMLRLSNILTVAGASQDEVINAIQNEDFSDFEDCLQDKCAKEAGCDYIVTANLRDFINSEVPAIAPDELLKFMEDNL